MNPNATLLGQIIVFVILIWFAMKFIWPPLLGAVEERRKKIAEGLAAADRGEKDLVEAKATANGIVRESRDQAAKIVDQANRRGNEIVDEAKQAAVVEGQRLVGDARQEIDIERSRAREQLRKEVAGIALTAAGRLLGREIDAKAHADILDKLALDIERG